ncbi:PREDICTED: uncharacterized protein LOC106123410 [Papilio xuthus]|uniref:Uncharacterized protein LOC106123410 n=1 Tax=Papilio xuthus TaxID=66420 RepID=A0AAJ7EFC3_PAPXU|nr:PREDICTED: uncharacterized protein LOC106123410 [Papilio xuthus]
MFSVFDKLFIIILFGIIHRSEALVELPKLEVDDLVRTEKIIRNTTNNILSSLKFKKPINSTRIKEFSTLHHYFLSITFRHSSTLREIARLTRIDYKKYNNATENLTTAINELLDDGQCSNEKNITSNKTSNEDTNVLLYVDNFLAKLETLKESYGVNKVFSDINSNIIKLLDESRQASFRSKTNVTNLSHDHLFDSSEYWVPSGRRIYKGERTKIKHYPFMASIQIFDVFQCAGSIIKSDLIITASSCLQLAWNNRFYRENPAFLAVRVGSSFYNSGGERIAILEIYFHPDYNPKSLWNNICVLRLERHIEFLKDNVKSVKKIAIDKNPWNLPVNTPGITIIGWGAKSTSNKVGDPFHNILSYSHLDVYPTRECQEVYTKEYVTKQNFCGGFFSKGGGACNRDVGAPGIIGGTLVGVVSFGSPVCGTPDAPTVFTKVGYYYRWIENIMEMDVPRSKKKATTKYTLDPYEQYLTTTPATTIFKIEPLLGGKPPSVLDDTDYEDNENALRTLDDKLFQEFLETMFGSKEVKKYEDVIHQDGVVLRETKEKKTVKQIDVTTTEISLQPVTYAYDSDIESPRTQIIPVDTYEVTDPIQVTENIEVEESYSKYVDPKHKSKIERNKPKDIVYDIPVTTTEEAQEIYLELAPDSGKDSHDQSNQEQSIDNQEQIVDQSEAVSKGKESSETSSADISEIPGEEVIAELLDEIDFNQILREVSTDATIPKSSRPGYATKLERHRFLSTTTESANAKYYNIPREFKSADGVVESGNNSLLTLLYLSDGEKKRNVNKYNLNVEISRSKKINPRHFKRDNTLYNLGPKTELYRIISRVIEAAMSNQK